MTAHAARLSDHFDNMKGEEELLAERRDLVIWIDLADVRHARNLDDHYDTPIY